MSMSSSRPYLLRALYQWIIDNNCTPYILVNAKVADVIVPEQYVENGQIVLNLSPSAIVGLEIGNSSVSFNGRFSGVATDIFIPIQALLGIYAKENGQGMIFSDEDPDTPTTPPSKGNGGSSKRASLKVVK